ncbi:MAG: selenocysteine-specific translation elongation factor [Acetobacteraceae bacterium]|nr:selenocysteine-specific translation elongation factor [Acetobacteraceae bacterium]
MIIGTAGHVDHGKTTLIHALTGIDADRLPEEKRRGMTIDLGYAYAGGLGFVDVPGHERFVHTMLAGVGGIDAALLVVAADDGIKPQTLEHVAILDLLGIDRGVVAITRSDLAPGEVGRVTADIAALLADTCLATAPILVVSAITGAGIEDLRSALAALGPKPRDRDAYPRLAIDRAFLVAGAGVVVTGALASGTIAVGDRLVLSPSGAEVRVRGLHAQNQRAERGVAGQRLALNLVGADKAAVVRGDYLVATEIHAPTQRIDARIRLLPGARALRADTPMHLHLGAAHVTARVSPLASPIGPGEIGLVRAVLDQPVAALIGDRLVLRDAGATKTLGGGVVLDPWPILRGARSPARLAQLAAPDLAAMLALTRINWAAHARGHNLRPAAEATQLQAADAVLCGGYALAVADLAGLDAAITAGLAALHRDHPEQPGLTQDRLRASLPGKPPRALAAAVIDRALRAGILRQDGAFLCLADHRAQLSATDAALWEILQDELAADRFRPPRVRDLLARTRMSEPVLRASMRRFARLSWLVEVAPDHFYLRDAVAEMVAIAAELAARDGDISAGGFRDRVGIGRNLVIRILEFLDAQGVTYRRGDIRHIRADRLERFGVLEKSVRK